MATIRVEKTANYTVLSNHHLDDPRLSLKAVGLLSYMLRQPDGWDFTVEWLAGRHKDGRDSIRACLKELEAAGYVVRSRTHQSNGTFGRNDYIVREFPESPLTENPPMVEPSAGKPTLANPTLENPTQVSTNNPSTNIPPIVPPEGTPSAAEAAAPPEGEPGVRKRKKRKSPEPKAAPDWKPERFAAFWEVYPRGESKQDAIKAWDKLHADDQLLAVMGKGLKRQLKSESWKRNIGIPYAATWLNDRRWEDTKLDGCSAPASEPDTERKLVGEAW